MRNHTLVSVDVAKNVLEVAVSHAAGRVSQRKRLSRNQFLKFCVQQETATFLLEACSSSHYWGRRLQEMGHHVVLLPPHAARPYVTRNKTDRTDAKGLLEAYRNEDIKPVPVKSVEQHAIAALHRLRFGWKAERTARINCVRGILRELGIVLPVGARAVVRVLGRISKRGDVYLRMLLIHGARAVLLSAKRMNHPDPLRTWALEIEARRGHNKAAVAVANKIARIVWAVWLRQDEYNTTSKAA